MSRASMVIHESWHYPAYGGHVQLIYTRERRRRGEREGCGRWGRKRKRKVRREGRRRRKDRERERERERDINEIVDTPLHHDNSHLVSAHSSSVLGSPLCCSNQLPEPGARPHHHRPAPYQESDDLKWVHVEE